MTNAQEKLYRYVVRNDFVYIDDARRFKTVANLVELGLATTEVITEGRSVTLKVRKVEA